MKNTKTYLVIILGIIGNSLCIRAAVGNLTTYPTFESCGIYLPYSDPADECRVFFRKNNESNWTAGYPPVFDTEAKEFRGSLVRLSENTIYKVKAEIYYQGNKTYTSSEISFATWNPNVTIGATHDISEYKTGSGNTAYYLINNVQGSANAWVKITSSSVLDMLSCTAAHAIQITNSKYVILEGITLIGGGKNGISVENANSSTNVTVSDIRIINCNISKWGRASNTTTSKGVYVDDLGNEINYDGGVRIYKAKNIVVERCYIHDSKAKSNAWYDVIQEGAYAGNTYSNVHPKGPTGIFVDRANAGIVLRYNDVIGSQSHRFNDVIETAQNGDVIGGFTKDGDIYGNMLALGRDDGIELDGGQCNIRMYNNRLEQTYTGISTAPNRKGPSYIFNNVIWNMGDGAKSVRQSVAVKNGGDVTYTKGRQFFFNNTMVVERNCISGVGYGDGEKRAMYWATTRNNILVSGRTPSAARPESSPQGSSGGDGLSISDRESDPTCDFDYDLLGNTVVSNGQGAIYAQSGSEAHAVKGLPKFADITQGNFTITSSNDIGIDKGVFIPGFSTAYQGLAPDMGAFEYGASSLMPIRPLAIQANKYMVDFGSSNAEQIITFTVGDIGNATSFKICKSEDMTWVRATASINTINSNSTFTLRFNAGKTNGTQVGVILVRLPDGLSIPVTVKANISTGEELGDDEDDNGGDNDGDSLVVTNSANDGAGTLRDIMMNVAQSGDSITIADNINEIVLTGEIRLSDSKNLTINGQGCTVKVAEPNVSAYRAFCFNYGTEQTVSLYNLTIQGGDISAISREDNYSGGALWAKRVHLRMYNCTVSGTAKKGGALADANNTDQTFDLVLDGCTFINCTAKDNAGALNLLFDDGITIKNCIFQNNQMVNASGSSAIYVSKPASISNCLFRNNSSNKTDPSKFRSAAVAIETGEGVVSLDNCTFDGNYNVNTSEASAITKKGNSILKLTNCTFYNNSGGRAAVYVRDGNATIVNCTFAGNQGKNSADNYGGALHSNDSILNMTLVNNIFTYNYNSNNLVKDVFINNDATVLIGCNNLIAAGTGTNMLQNIIPFTYNTGSPDNDTPVFAGYTTINGNKVPLMDITDNVIRLSANSVAIGAGTVNFANVYIPSSDQLGNERGNPSDLGAVQHQLANGIVTANQDIRFIQTNPANGILQLYDNAQILQLNIIDLNGKIILSKNLPSTTIFLNKAPTGLYLARFVTNKGIFYEKFSVY